MLSPNFTPFPTLNTERLHLRKVTPNDAPEMFFMRSDERVMKYIDKERAKTVEEGLAFITLINDLEANNNAVTWAITLKGDPKLIGTVCLWNFKKAHYRAEIGYALHPDLQRQGFMQEVITTVLDYGFNTLHLHSIEAIINPGNTASASLLEKNNFVREAYYKENFFYNGHFLDSAVYSLLKANFK